MKKIIKFISIFVFVFSFCLVTNAEELTGTDINEEGLITRGEFAGATSYKMYVQNSLTEASYIKDFENETATLMSFLDNEAGLCNQTAVKPYGLTGKCKESFIDTYVLTIKAFDEDNNALASSRIIVNYDGETYTKIEGNKHFVVINAGGGVKIDNKLVDDGALIPVDQLETTNKSLMLEGWYTEPEFTNLFEFEEPITSDLNIYAKWVVNFEAFSEPEDGGLIQFGKDTTTQTNHLTSTFDVDSDGLENATIVPEDGWEFKGWKLDSPSGKDVGVDTAENVYTYYGIERVFFKLIDSYKLYAIFEPKGELYTITFDSNGGSSVASKRVVEGYKLKRQANPVKEGFEFMGWYTDSELTEEFDFDSLITENKTLYAKWLDNTTEFTVTFDTDGGSSIDSQTVLVNKTATKPENPTKEDAVFIDWYKDSELTQKFDFNSPITEDTTIYAKFLESGEKLTVTFVYNVDEMNTAVEVGIGQKVTRPDDPVKEGLIFNGWYEDSEFSKQFDFNTAILDDTVLYAKWSVRVTVTAVPSGAARFFTDDESNATDTFESLFTLGSGKGEVSYVLNHGYKFKEWRLGSSTGQLIDTINTANVYGGFNEPKVYFKLISGYDIYAIFDRESYTVTFDSTGGSEVESQIVLFGEKAQVPAEPENDIQIFQGWYKDSELTEKYNFDEGITDDITLYAKWVSEYKMTKAPKIGIADGNNNSLFIKFPKDNNIRKYNIYRATSKKGKYTLVGKNITNNNSGWTDKKLTYGKTYYYKVIASNSLGKTGYSNIVSRKVTPNKVTNLKAKKITTNSIKISWDKASGSGYQVYMGTSKSKLKKVSTIKKDKTVTYNKTKLKANTTYYYKVRSYKTVKKKKIYGPWSAVVAIKTAPVAPKLTVAYKNNTSLNVSYTQVKGATYYVFGMSDDGETYYNVNFEPSFTFEDDAFDDMQMNKRYYFQVKACNENNSCSEFVKVNRKIGPKTPSVSLKTSSKKVTVTVKNVPDCEGYEVQKKDGSKGTWKTVKVLAADDNMTFTNKTKKGNKYYYRVRSFITVDEGKVYSDYSGSKKITSK